MNELTESSQAPVPQLVGRLRSHWPQLVLLLILAVGAYLRFAGLGWDEDTHIHPDERFLTLVENALEPVDTLSEYFNTDTSTLNPANVGYRFYVYGTLPIFIVRYLGEWLGQSGYGQIHLVGRAVSATFDLLSILLVYLVGRRLYRERVGLLAAAFAAVSVLLIQHAHFFVVDPMANTFILAGFYMAVLTLDEGRRWDYALFGVFLGMAVASKISSAPLAGLIALAALARYSQAPEEQRPRELREGIQGVFLSAVVSLVVFRLLQPYAFAGPSILGIRLNPDWLSVMSEIRQQASGSVDFPPALQWADRTPILFSLRNIVLWGLGLPLGLVAWGSFGWAFTRLFKGRSWDRHLLPVVWTGGYFLLRSSGFTQAMRYQLPIYPTLAILAAWGIWAAWDRASSLRPGVARWMRPAVGLLGGGVLLLTAAYAFGFHRIYREPITRVEASRWIYSHVPSAVSVAVSTAEEELLEPVAVPEEFVLRSGQSGTFSFTSRHQGEAGSIQLHSLRSEGLGAPARLSVALFQGETDAEPLAVGTAEVGPSAASGGPSAIRLDPSVTLEQGAAYSLQLSTEGERAVQLEGTPALVYETDQGTDLRPTEGTGQLAADGNTHSFSPGESGEVHGVRLPGLAGTPTTPLEIRVTLTGGGQEAALASVSRSFVDPQELVGPIEIAFSPTAYLVAGESYVLDLEISADAGIVLEGATIIHETSWDDGLPLRVEGYDIAGRYPERNLELYWPDDEDSDQNGRSDKLERITNSLAEGDYLFISSNRQYGTIARVPNRYPLTTTFYRELFNCPPPQPVWRCADSAVPGKLNSELGYELVEVFDRNPKVFGIEISDQGAEESFTVYDHPQAMIFAKTPDFSRERAINLLEQVDISDLHQAPPKELRANNAPLTLMLPQARWQRLRQGGTWRALFPASNPLNRSQPLAVILWWLATALIGVIALPFSRRAFPGLVAAGYGIARVVGLLLFAWLAWLAGSLGLPVSRLSLLLILLGLALIAAATAWWDRERLLDSLRRYRKEILTIEALALALFLLFLLIRLGNPDLWHPSKGGEKPMDLSYLIAVLKSPTFPPYDPWFAGGYINYYYFGFLFVGMPIKLLGIDPGVAYNLVLPTLFALLGLAAYTGGYHLVAPGGNSEGRTVSRIAGFSAAISLCLLGNLGTVRMLWDAFQGVGGAGAATDLLGGIVAAIKGIFEVLFRGESLPIALDAWYWQPSRAIPPGPGEPGPITEFPFFTFLYADLHAHMISLPLTVTSLVWSISWLRSGAARGASWAQRVFPLAVGALVIGSLRPTNTWDFPVYLILGGLAAAGAAWLREGRFSWRAAAGGALSAAILVGLAFLLFQPYTRWYGQGYTEAQLWEGAKTNLSAYLTVYGLFLFVLVSWLAWETREWMASTPITYLARLRPWFSYLLVLGIALAIGVFLVYSLGYWVIVLVFPLILWVGLLSLRRNLAVGKRVVLFVVGTGLALTLVVEVVVLQGDIGRMNTVFKFYLQVWTLLSLAAGAALAWIVKDLGRWPRGVRGLWQLALVGLVFGAGLYPVTATPAKIRDRMAREAPHTLDGTAFMLRAERSELGQQFKLDEDYRAIHWLQAEVEGSPVIIEANIPEYRWGTRFTIHTGLPNVLGWNWHQRQQRVASGTQRVTQRAEAISDFYTTRSVEAAQEFLEEYEVEYVIVGALERIYYGTIEPCLADGSGGVTCDLGGRPVGVGDPPVGPEACEPLVEDVEDSPLSCPTFGLDKFERLVSNGVLELAYETGDTRIYRVLP